MEEGSLGILRKERDVLKGEKRRRVLEAEDMAMAADAILRRVRWLAMVWGMFILLDGMGWAGPGWVGSLNILPTGITNEVNKEELQNVINIDN